MASNRGRDARPTVKQLPAKELHRCRRKYTDTEIQCDLCISFRIGCHATDDTTYPLLDHACFTALDVRMGNQLFPSVQHGLRSQSSRQTRFRSRDFHVARELGNDPGLWATDERHRNDRGRGPRGQPQEAAERAELLRTREQVAELGQENAPLMNARRSIRSCPVRSGGPVHRPRRVCRGRLAAAHAVLGPGFGTAPGHVDAPLSHARDTASRRRPRRTGTPARPTGRWGLPPRCVTRARWSQRSP
jgi:transposase-like protein